MNFIIHRALAKALLCFGLFGMCIPRLVATEADKVAFDIPAGDASVSLKSFAQQSGQEIIYPSEKVKGTQTNAVKGSFGVKEALDLMLANTALVAVQNKDGVLSVGRQNDPNAPRVAPRSISKAATPDDVLQLGEFNVTVTVQKRAESAQEVPISMTAMSATQLDTYQISSLSDLSRLTPNLLVSSFSYASPTIAIRGANNTFSQIGVEKPVAVVVDDVYIPRNSANTFELFDLNSAEVLRGPQGTLFGRNVTGGAIVFNTNQPSLSAPEYAAEATYGNFNDFEFQGLVGMPISDSIAAKVTVLDHTRDGVGHDLFTGRQEDNIDSSAVRGQVLIKPRSNITDLVSMDYSDDRNNERVLAPDPGVGLVNDPRLSELNYPQHFARIVWGFSNHLDIKTAVGDLTSITAYRTSQSADNYSNVGLSYTLLAAGSQAATIDLDHPSDLTEELRYASPKWNHFDFVSGLYYLNEDGYRNVTSLAFAAGTGRLITDTIANERVYSRSYAGYWDGVIHLLPSVDLTLGGRFTVDRKQGDVVHSDLVTAANSFSASGLSKEWREFTPRTVLTWSPHKDVKWYASVTKGYTAGGFNGDAAVLSAYQSPFNPETVVNYETGLKSGFLHDRIHFNVAVFDEKYRNKQELYFNSITRVLNIYNASQATIKGSEFEAAYSPVDGVNLTASLGLLNARYDSFVVPGVLNYTGNPLGSSPNHKYAFGGDFERAIGKLGYATAMFSSSTLSGYYTGATKAATLFVPGYSLANANVGYLTPDRRWRLIVWCHNLGNTEYLLTPSNQTVLSEYLGEPRTYGVTIGFRY